MTPAEETQKLAQVLMSLVHGNVLTLGTINAKHLLKALVEIEQSAAMRIPAESERAARLRAAIKHVEP